MFQPDGTHKTVYAAYKNTPPSAPANFKVVAGDGQAGLTWQKNSESDFRRYWIYMDTYPNPATLVDSTTGISDTSKTISGLTNYTTYYFRVTAVDNDGNQSSYSNEISVVVAPATGNAMSFDGVDDYVNLGDPAVFPSGVAARSLCAWAKTNSIAAGNRPTSAETAVLPPIRSD